MKHKLLFCEQCENIVSVLNNHKKVFVCPLCGTLNERDREKTLTGYIKLISPKTKCKVNTGSTDDIDFNKISASEREALSLLNYSGWRIIFVNGDPDKNEPPANERRKL